MMGITGHKERALLRRGLHVKEALQRRDTTLNEVALKRRTLTEGEEGYQQEKLKLHGLCGDDTSRNVENSVYCRTIELLDSMDNEAAKDTYESMDEIYRWYRNRIKNDNRKLFKKTLEVILKNENPGIAFKLVASYLKDPAISQDSILDSLKKLIEDNGEVKEGELEDFLRKARSVEYSKYEKSFQGQHFDLLRGYIELKHGFEGPFYNIIIGILHGRYQLNNVVDVIVNTILNMNHDELLGKADLKVPAGVNLVDSESGEVVLPENSKVEVKKMDYKLDSYFSEFFAIYKNPKNFPDYINNPRFREIYNTVIDSVYERMLTEGESILDDIANSITAIIYENNRIVLMDDIELYWSNRGQRGCDDHRLSIRYRIVNEHPVSFIYTKGYNELKREPITVPMGDRVVCPLVNRP